MDTYEDIIHLSHHVSEKHPPMSRLSRAGQFAPFAALTGYDAAVKEAGRYTASQIVLSEDAIARLDRALIHLARLLDKRPFVRVTYFLPDPRKEGGAYVTKEGSLKDIPAGEACLVLTDKTKIPLSHIQSIASPYLPDDDI